MTVYSVDFDNRTVRVLGKGRKERLVPIGVAACRYLREYIRSVRPRYLDPAHPHSDRLWWNIFKQPQGVQMPGTMVREYARRVGIARPVTTHTLRRSCATHMLQNGAHPAMIAQLLGHATLATLGNYLRVTITELMKTHRRSKLGK
jgi:integrase/recombinase XerD